MQRLARFESCRHAPQECAKECVGVVSTCSVRGHYCAASDIALSCWHQIGVKTALYMGRLPVKHVSLWPNRHPLTKAQHTIEQPNLQACCLLCTVCILDESAGCSQYKATLRTLPVLLLVLLQSLLPAPLEQLLLSLLRLTLGPLPGGLWAVLRSWVAASAAARLQLPAASR